MPSKKVVEKETEEVEKTTEKSSSPAKSSPSKTRKPRTKKVYPKRDTTKIALPKDFPKRLIPESTKRKVQKVKLFGTEDEEEKEEKEIVIPKGKGKKLEDCDNVAKEINNRLRSDDLLRTVHQVLLGRVNKKTALKDNLLAFNGVVYEDSKGREKLEQKLERLTVRTLKELCAFFGQDPDGTRDELVPRLADFLEKPKPSDTTYSYASVGSKKRARSASSSRGRSSSPAKKRKTKKDPNAPKKARSSYIFFCNEHRDSLVKKYPNEKITDIAKRLGEKWKKVSSSDKKKFEAKAEKDKERYAKEMKSYNKKK